MFLSDKYELLFYFSFFASKFYDISCLWSLAFRCRGDGIAGCLLLGVVYDLKLSNSLPTTIVPLRTGNNLLVPVVSFKHVNVGNLTFECSPSGPCNVRFYFFNRLFCVFGLISMTTSHPY